MTTKAASKKWKTVIKAVLFLTILLFLVLGIQRVLDLATSKRYEVWTDYYDEPKGTLDAVYIGASSVYNFWIAPSCWEEYGYTVFPLSFPSMHIDFVPYVIEEARKTNPDALYIICLNSLKSAEKLDESRLHNTLDYMRLSENKIAMINDMSEKMGIRGLDKLEWYFPLVRFHSRWTELKKEDFDFSKDELKAASTHANFLSRRRNVKDKYVTTQEKADLSDIQEASLQQLLDYCDDNSVNALFVINPQPLKEEAVAAQFNTIEEIVSGRGYKILNMLDKTEEMGLCLTTDFYDYLHTNIHGAMKDTRYLSEYLKNNYDFKDKRELAGYESWNNAAEKYKTITAPSLFDIENIDTKRFKSKPVRITSQEVSGTKVELCWKQIDEAEQYAVYRKTGTAAWESLAFVDKSVSRYTDDLPEDGDCFYAVIPVKTRNGSLSYGDFIWQTKAVRAEAGDARLTDVRK